jgi:capsular exopolysaccharide synthesis family protein
VEIADYLKILRRRWISIVLCAVVIGVGALGLSLLQTKQYSSNARLFVSTAAADQDGSALNSAGQFAVTRVQSYANLISSRELASTVIQKLGINMTPEELADEVKASVAAQTVNLTITAKDPDPHQAQSIAQGYAEAMVNLISSVETPQGQSTAPIKATIIDNASYNDSPVSPRKKRNIGLGLVIGLMLGLGQAVLRQTLDTRINSAEDVAEITDAPVLGTIGYDSQSKEVPLISAIPSHSPRAEAFRVLRTNLQFVDVDTQHKVFVLTSAAPEEGKTTSAVNLALSLAQAGVRTLLIEGDLRRPRAAQRLGLDGAVGVTSVLVGKVKFEDALQHDEKVGLDFLASGPVPPNPAELLQSKAMRDLVNELRGTYDVVVIDAPPLLPVTDAALIAAHADGAILVIRHGKISRDQLKISAQRLAQVDARLVGVIMNMVPTKGNRYGYGYGYGYGYAPDRINES